MTTALLASARTGWRRGLRSLVLPAVGVALLLAIAAPLEPPPLQGLPSATEGRGAAWLLGALVLLPLAAWQASRPLDAERTWRRSLPGGERVAWGEAVGLGLACLAAVTTLGLGVEARQDPAPAWREVRSVDVGSPRRIPAGEELAVAIDPGPAPEGARLAVRVASGGGAGPTTRVRLESLRGEGAPAAPPVPEPQLVDGAARLRVPLPAGDGPVRLVVAADGPGDAVLRGGRSVVLEAPIASARLVSLELGLLLLADLLALVFVVGLARARLGAPVATLTGLSVLALGWLGTGSLPGHAFAAALELAGRGALTAGIGASTLAQLALVPMAALATSLRRGR